MNMKMFFKRLGALFITLIVFATWEAPRPAAAVLDHSDKQFSEMIYARPELSEFDAISAEIKQLSGSEANGQSVLNKYEQLKNLLEELETMLTLAMINHFSDAADKYWTTEYILLSDYWRMASNTVLSCSKVILNSACGEEALTNWDDITLQRARYTMTYTDRQFKLMIKENELLAKYSLAVVSSYDSIQIKRGVLADIYIELMKIRSRLAKECGYNTYAEYSYAAIYGRDYTPKQALELGKSIKKYIVPLFESLFNEYLGYYMQLEGYFEDISTSNLMEKVDITAGELSPKIAEALDYMLEHNLYNAKKSDQKANISFTTILASYRAPYMFLCPDGSAYDLITITHELGHYFYYYTYPYGSWYSNTSLDVAEIHSMALQLLFTDYYDKMLGTEKSELAQKYTYFQSVYSLLTGCFYDEFQQRTYALCEPTYEQIDAIYMNLLEEYGLAGKTKMYWTQITHNFEEPFYYISYSVSAASAWEIWLRAQTDPVKAMENYQNTIHLGHGNHYRTVLMLSGLRDPFSGEYVRGLEKKMEVELLYGCPFLDILEHWCASSVAYTYGQGLFSGTGKEAFSPDESMTRAMFVTVLGRLLGEDEINKTEPVSYADVERGAYYAPYVSWAMKAGVLTGYSDGTFHPHERLIRQDMAVMLLRACEYADMHPCAGEIKEYSDTQRISPWCVKAVERLSSCGILNGRPGGAFDPVGTVSRAEAAAVITRLSEYLDLSD